LKKLCFALLLVAAAFLIVRTPAMSTSGTLYTSKNIALQITITPSPVGYLPHGTTAQGVAARALTSVPPTSQMVAYDPFTIGDMVAQIPQGNVKVNFTVKLDPTAQYLHVTPINPNLTAGYGPNTWTCVYQVYAYYAAYPYYVTDYGNGTVASGTAPFPIYNYPTTSLLQWEAETITTSFAAFSNSGSPGQTAFSGTKGEKQTVCFDLSLNVPSTVAAGTYTATIQYNLEVEL
jgi:hypothetical protein